MKQFTFKSEFLPLLRTECKAIQAFYNVSYRHTRPHLTEQEIASLQNLEKAIDDLFVQHFPVQKGAFVRLCGRSPKDGEPLLKTHVYRDYEQHLAALRGEEGREVTMHMKMAAIARTSWLKVGNVEWPKCSLHSSHCYATFSLFTATAVGAVATSIFICLPLSVLISVCISVFRSLALSVCRCTQEQRSWRCCCPLSACMPTC